MSDVHRQISLLVKYAQPARRPWWARFITYFMRRIR